LENVVNKKILGENIFLVDLVSLKEKIEIMHPEFKEILVRRALPNRLLVQVKRRNPVMQVKSDKFYLIDEEGVVLPSPKTFADDELPVVGQGAASINMAKHSQNSSQGVNKALLLIKEMTLNKRLAKYKIKIIDITDQRNISFFIDIGNVEVKIGDTEFGKRLDTLAALLGQLGEDIGRVKYIDLRFEDPIVGPK
jgi:cell division septal protein FtsQ